MTRRDEHTGAPALILPDWPAPATVRAACTTRVGGVSAAPFDAMNLADHVGDDPAAVAANRVRLQAALGLPAAPCWLRQVHGTRAVPGHAHPDDCEADASHTDRPGVVCAVLTADCLPVLLCDRAGTRVAAVHAGWRGLCAGVIETAAAALQRPGEELLAWLGPAIGADAFEVGNEVRAQFLAQASEDAAAFRAGEEGRWFADLYALARRRLARCGVDQVYGGGWCTYRESDRFFSYRRDASTGRMATLIWLAEAG